MQRRTVGIVAVVLTLSIASLLASSAKASENNAHISWIGQFGTSQDDQALGVALDATGAYVVGYTMGTLPGQVSLGASDGFVAKFSLDGEMLWTRQIGTPGDDTVEAAAVYNGNLYVVGSVQIQTAETMDAFVAKFSLDGELVWYHPFGSDYWDDASAVSADGSGIYVAGSTGGVLAGGGATGRHDGFLVQFASDGTQQWAYQFSIEAGTVATGVSAFESAAYVAGYAYGETVGVVGFLMRVASDGIPVWTQRYTTSGFDPVTSVSTSADGVFIGGMTEVQSPTPPYSKNQGGFVAKYSHVGAFVWAHFVGTPGFTWVTGVSAYAGAVYATGLTCRQTQSHQRECDAFAEKSTADGSFVWSVRIGTPNGVRGNGIAASSTGVFVAGTTFGALYAKADLGGSDAFVALVKE